MEISEDSENQQISQDNNSFPSLHQDQLIDSQKPDQQNGSNQNQADEDSSQIPDQQNESNQNQADEDSSQKRKQERRPSHSVNVDVKSSTNSSPSQLNNNRNTSDTGNHSYHAQSSSTKVAEKDWKAALRTIDWISCVTCMILLSSVIVPTYLKWSSISKNSDTTDRTNAKDWRDDIHALTNLSEEMKNTIVASMKPIFEKSPSRSATVSTLLIVSTDEENAKELSVCLLKKMNKIQKRNQRETILDMENYKGNKIKLNGDLEDLLTTGDDIKAVTLQRIDLLWSNRDRDQLNLLFAYCDGENPKVPDRLIIMTAQSEPPTEAEIRRQLEEELRNDKDFIDALLARISGLVIKLDVHQNTQFCD